eukprot:5782504-Alexandrium_andersonii.AAC.1
MVGETRKNFSLDQVRHVCGDEVQQARLASRPSNAFRSPASGTVAPTSDLQPRCGEINDAIVGPQT